MGQSEDYRLEDSVSDSSEQLLQRGRGKVSIHVILVKGRVYAVKHRYFAESFCQSQVADVTMKDFSAFLDMRRCKDCPETIYISEDLFGQFFPECRAPHS